MKSTTYIVSLVAASLMLCAAGCGKKGASKKPPRKRRGQPVRTTGVGGIDFNRYWPREEVVKLTAAERAELRRLALVGMRGNNWEHARDVLVALRKEAMPPLIKLVESAEPTAASADPFPAVIGTRVKTLGQLSHDILLQIVQYHTDYKGHLPVRKRLAKYPTYTRSSQIPVLRPSRPAISAAAKTIRVSPRAKGTSNRMSIASRNCSGRMRAADPVTNARFSTLAPRMFPTEICSAFLRTALMAVNTSGSDVPKATNTSETTASLMPRFRARRCPNSTSKKAPIPTRIPPRAKKPPRRYHSAFLSA